MCEAIDRNMIFYSHANRTHKKGFTLSFVLKKKVFGTRNWPITSIAEFMLRRIIHRERDKSTNYSSETDNSSKYKFGAKTNYGARFV